MTKRRPTLEAHEVRILLKAADAMIENDCYCYEDADAEAPVIALAATLAHIKTVLVATYGDPTPADAHPSPAAIDA